MSKGPLALGLDLSTQSLSCVVLDVGQRAIVYEHSIDYVEDPRVDRFGVRREDYILPPTSEGEAEQPPEMYFAVLDAILGDMQQAGVALGEVAVVNSSGQQHGQVYLNGNARSIFSRLNEADCERADIAHLLEGCLSYRTAPIWMTSNTAKEADYIRDRLGGAQSMIQVSGSDIPLRFTAAVIRRVAQQFPDLYRHTDTVQLISGLVPAILTGNPRVAIDFGSAAGTSLMDYARRQWSDLLLRAAAGGLPGGEEALREKLPAICPPDSIVGTVAAYFVRKYGFDPACKVVAGSGDNPQSKVLVKGDLLSLGSSIVNMVSTDGRARDLRGFANSMYDGVGRPFMFGCRTNGALVWDRLRAAHGMKKEEYGPAEEAIRTVPVGHSLVFWQPRNESFPPSASFGIVRVGDQAADLGHDYAGLIETALTSVYHHSKDYATATDEPLHVTGGAALSPGVMRRVAAMWRRTALPVKKGGAALGAAVAGACALRRSEGEGSDLEQVSAALLGTDEPIRPWPDDVSATHRPGGYLDRFVHEEEKLIERYRSTPT